MFYDNIQLIPVDTRRVGYRGRENSWHLPGGEIVTTEQLVARGRRRGVPVVLHERTETGGERAHILS